MRTLFAVAAVFIALSPAHAQQRADDVARGITQRAIPNTLKPIGPIGRAVEGALSGGEDTTPGAEDLLGKIDAAALPDAKYALKIAQAAGSALIVTCLDTVVKRIEARQEAVKDMEAPPEPALITKAVRVMIAFDGINPDSPLMVSCSPLANKVKMKTRDLIGQIVTGGAGLAKIFVGLP